MKKIAIYSLCLFSVAALFSSCRKEDNSKLPKGLARFPTPQIAKVAGTDQTISAVNPGSFTGKFTVAMYFPGDTPPQKYDVVVRKNGDNTNIKSIQANVTTFPATITVTGTQLQTLFPGAIVLGDRFDFGVDVTTAEGIKFEAFPVTGAAYASGISAQPGASTSVQYAAICQYDPNIYKGSFVVVTDEWADYVPGDVIQLTMVDATHFSFMYLAANPSPIVVTVNADNSVTVPKQVYGSGYPPGWTFGNISAESVPSADNAVAPCEGTFAVHLSHTAGAIGFGTGHELIKLRKQ
jgi:hypothetical protein